MRASLDTVDRAIPAPACCFDSLVRSRLTSHTIQIADIEGQKALGVALEFLLDDVACLPCKRLRTNDALVQSTVLGD